MADSLYDCPTCGGDCNSIECVKFITQDCADAIELCESEICTILYSCPDADDATLPEFKPTNWESQTDWDGIIDSGDMCKVNVIGDMPEPEQETITISKRRKKVGDKQFTLNATIDEWTKENYDAMRKWECGATIFLWFQTIDGALYGGENGIRLDITKANSPLTRGENQYKNILLEMQWDNKCHPPVTTAVAPL